MYHSKRFPRPDSRTTSNTGQLLNSQNKQAKIDQLWQRNSAFTDVPIETHIPRKTDVFTEPDLEVILKDFKDTTAASEARLNKPLWNSKLKSLKEAAQKVLLDLVRNEKYTEFPRLLELVMKELAGAFALKPQVYVTAKYTAISICEEILYNLAAQQAPLTIFAHLYYHLANFHSHSEHEAWRSNIYANALEKLTRIENQDEIVINDLFTKVQKHHEPPSAGIFRFLQLQTHHVEDMERELIVNFESNEANDILINALNEDKPQSRINWSGITKFSILTGANGVGKTMLINSIYKKLKQKTLDVFHEASDRAREQYYALYIKSELTGSRKVYGTGKSYDFHHSYVLDIIKLLEDFSESNTYKKVEAVKKANDSFTYRVAISLFDRILCGVVTKEEAKSPAFIIKVAETLAFSENLLSEPVTLVENLFKQHLDLFLDDLFSVDTVISNQALEFLRERIAQDSSRQGDFPQAINNLRSDFLQAINNLFDDDWSQDRKDQYALMMSNPDTAVQLNGIANYIDSHREVYHTLCQKYLKDYKEITPPLEILQTIAKKTLDYNINFKWAYYHSKGNFLRFEKPQNTVMEINAIYLYEENNNWFYHSVKMREKDQLGISLEQDIDFVDSKDERTITNAGATKLYQAISARGILPLGKYRLEFLKQEVAVSYSDLSSGELTAMKLVLWAYLANGIDYRTRETQEDKYSKVKILLLDEIDKHLDPKLTKSLIKIIQEDFITKGIQVFMSTHRPDTLALANNPAYPEEHKAKIYTLQREGSSIEIENTHPLLAMFRMTKNLREITGFHIKIYTEGFNDALFYEKIYAILSQKNYLKLSKRYTPEFHAMARTDANGGGCQAVIDEVIFNILSFNRVKRAESGVVSYKAALPFGIIDDDNGKYAIKIDERITSLHSPEDEKNLCREHVLSLTRYSLENFLYDPFVISSILTSYADRTNVINLIPNIKLQNTIYKLIEINEAFEEGEGERVQTLEIEIQSIVNQYFQTIFENQNNFDGIRIEKVKKLTEEALKAVKKYRVEENEGIIKLKEELNALQDKKLKTNKGQELTNKKSIIERQLDDVFKREMNKIEPTTLLLFEESELIEKVSQMIMEFYGFDPRLYDQVVQNVQNKYNRMHDHSSPNDKTNDRGLFAVTKPEVNPFSKVASAQIAILGHNKPLLCQYPIEFLSMPGHDVDEKGFFQLYNGDNHELQAKFSQFKRHIKEALFSAKEIYMPQDLAILFLELDCKIREQINMIIKPDSWTTKILHKQSYILATKQALYSHNNHISLVETLHKIANIYKIMKNRESALEYYQQASTMLKKINTLMPSYDGIIQTKLTAILSDSDPIKNVKLSQEISIIQQLSELDSSDQSSAAAQTVKMLITVSTDNPLLSIPNLILTLSELRDSEGAKDFIALGNDPDIASQIVEAVQISGLQSVIALFFPKHATHTPLLLENVNDRSNFDILDVLTKFIIGAKSADTITDLARLGFEPTIDNFREFGIDILHLNAMLYGSNQYLIAFNAIDTTAYFIKGEYQQGLVQIGKAIIAHALPYTIKTVGQEYAFILSGAAFIYVGYETIKNVYSLISNYGSKEFTLKSSLAYGNLFCHLGIKETAKTYLENAMQIIAIDKEAYFTYEYELIGMLAHCKIDSLIDSFTE